MSRPMAYPAQVDFDADRRITRGHALVQWLVAIPHLIVADVLRFPSGQDIAPARCCER